MEIVLAIIVLLIPFLVLYKLYEPKIDIVVRPEETVVLLWYTQYITGFPKERTFKILFTLKKIILK